MLDVAGRGAGTRTRGPDTSRDALVVTFHCYRSDVDVLRRMTRLDAKADQPRVTSEQRIRSA